MADLATIAAFGFPNVDPPRALATFRALGCRKCQYLCNPESPHSTKDVLRVTADAGLSIDSIHGSFGPDQDVSSPDPAVRQAMVDVHIAEGRLVRELGGTMVVVHPTPFLGVNVAPQGERSERLASLRDSAQQLAQAGRELGVIFLIENLPARGAVGSDPVELAQLIRRIDHPNLRMCFDTGHANLTSPPGKLPDVLAACLDVIAYCHVHDNDGQSDSHLIPGRGTIDWDRLRPVMARLPAHLPVMLELFDIPLVDQCAQTNGFKERLWKWLGVVPVDHP